MIWDSIVVGGGCAGLAAATALAEKGIKVLVVERRPFLGGRASSFSDAVTGEPLDNGQHLLLGCYRETRKYLKRIGSISNLSFDPSFSIEMKGPSGDSASLRPVALPAPLHLLGGLLRFGALSWKERFGMLRVARAIKQDKDLAKISVSMWLARLGQSRKSRLCFWDPITLATLNINPAKAPANLLATVLQDGFFASRAGAAVGLATVGLTQLHGTPSKEYLVERDGEVRTGTYAKRVAIRDNRVCGIYLSDGTFIQSHSVVSALPPPQARAFVEGTSLESSLAPSSALLPSPIVSMHLWMHKPPFSSPFVGLWGREFHWAFQTARFRKDVRTAPVTMVKSAATSFLSKGRREIQEIVEKELTVRVQRSVISIAREATWVQPIGNCSARLPTTTQMDNFFLAGDWTASPLPGTIESAVCSGHKASEALTRFLARQPASLTPCNCFATVSPQSCV